MRCDKSLLYVLHRPEYDLLFVWTGGQLAAAWVALRTMGEDGYMKMAQTLMDTTKKLINGINNIPVRTFKRL